MNDGSISLKISGPLLSKLFHESYCSEGYCGGKLFGEIISITKNEITDSDHRTSQHSTICVKDYQPMIQKRSFFINVGPDEIVSSNCVGFYRIRTSDNRLSLLEKSMHKALCRENLSQDRGEIVTLLITFDEHMDMSCLSWKLRAYIQKSDREFSVVKVHVTNLQGSVLNSYVTNPNPISGVLSSGACATLDAFQSSVSEKGGKIKLVDSTREVTSNLIAELEKSVDEFDRHQVLLENCHKERLMLSQELELLTAEVNKLEYQKSHPRQTSQLYSSMLKNNSGKTKRMAVPVASPTSRFEDKYEKMHHQSLEDMKLKSPVVVLKKIDLTADLEKASSSQALRLPVQGKPTNTSESVSENNVDMMDDLISFDDVA